MSRLLVQSLLLFVALEFWYKSSLVWSPTYSGHFSKSRSRLQFRFVFEYLMFPDYNCSIAEEIEQCFNTTNWSWRYWTVIQAAKLELILECSLISSYSTHLGFFVLNINGRNQEPDIVNYIKTQTQFYSASSDQLILSIDNSELDFQSGPL